MAVPGMLEKMTRLMVVLLVATTFSRAAPPFSVPTSIYGVPASVYGVPVVFKVADVSIDVRHTVDAVGDDFLLNTTSKEGDKRLTDNEDVEGGNGVQDSKTVVDVVGDDAPRREEGTEQVERVVEGDKPLTDNGDVEGGNDVQDSKTVVDVVGDDAPRREEGTEQVERVVEGVKPPDGSEHVEGCNGVMIANRVVKGGKTKTDKRVVGDLDYYSSDDRRLSPARGLSGSLQAKKGVLQTNKKDVLGKKSRFLTTIARGQTGNKNQLVQKIVRKLTSKLRPMLTRLLKTINDSISKSPNSRINIVDALFLGFSNRSK